MSRLTMSKIVITHAEVKAAQKALGRRTMTARQYRKLANKLKAERSIT